MPIQRQTLSWDYSQAPATDSSSNALDATQATKGKMIVDFTLGSLTDVTITPKLGFALSDDTIVWKSIYDGGQNIVSYTLTADFDGVLPIASNSANALRSMYLDTQAHKIRYDVVTNGSTLGSDLKIAHLPLS